MKDKAASMKDKVVKGPFPVPKSFRCPYCLETGHFTSFNEERGVAHYRCVTNENKAIGKKIVAKLTTYHQFAIQWVEGWEHCDIRGCSDACERVEVTSDWVGYDI